MEAINVNGRLYLSRRKYITDLLVRTKFQDAIPIPTLIPTGKKLSHYDGDPLHDALNYCSIVGALQYITFTHSNLSFSVNQVCQFMHEPTSSHWMAIKRILRYLKKTSTQHPLMACSTKLVLFLFRGFLM